MVNIIVSGAAGKMGQSILKLASADKEFKIVGTLESEELISKCPIEYKPCSNFFEIIGSADVVIDFSMVEPTLDHLKVAEKNRKAMVIGTTGFSAVQIEEINKASKSIPIVFSPNMSIGVNILFKLVEEVVKIMPDYDMEILEAHHNQKKDSPSGTALKLSQIIAGVLGKKLPDIAVYGRNGLIGPRKKGELGIMSIRAGDIVGDHTVYFAGPGERLELTHRATSRDTLARGAITAAKWVVKQKAGLYDMKDVLGLKG